MRFPSGIALQCLTLATAASGLLVGRSMAARYVALGASRCTMSILSTARDSVATYLLGRATPDTVLAGAEPVLSSFWQRPNRAVYGQVVRVDSLSGPDAHATRGALTNRRSTEVVVVPWGYSSGCGPDFWRESARWTTPDSSGLFSVRVRPESLWIAGRPTFDALYASIYSYAYGPYTVGPHTHFAATAGATLQGEGSLTPAEVFTLYTMLPTFAQAGDAAATRRLRDWVRANPRVQRRFPGTYILSAWSLDLRR